MPKPADLPPADLPPADLSVECGKPRKRVAKYSATWALAEIGDRWSFIVISVAFIGVRRFEDFLKRTGAPRSTLTTRLRKLEDRGILARRAYQQAPYREEYYLTAKGLDLYPQVMTSWLWERKWGVPYGAIARELVHQACGHVFQPLFECSHCHGDITVGNCSILPGPGAGMEDASPSRLSRRLNANSASMPSGGIPSQLADMVGDRWSALVLSALLYGLHKFAEIQITLGIAANILTDRLKALEANGMLYKKPYQLHPPRHEYWLTEKGKDIFPIAVAVTLWSDRWLAEPGKAPHLFVHKTCGHVLEPRILCNVCKQDLHPRDVRFSVFSKA